MYRTVLTGTYLGLLALALTCAGLAWFGTRGARYELERTNLAHAVLEAHIELDALTYSLFKQLTDAYLANGENRLDEAAARQRLIAQFDRVRAGIAQEVAFLGDREDETEELTRLAAIERKIQRVLDQFDAADLAIAADRTGRELPLLDEVLEREIDEEFRRLIDEAIAEERAEVVLAEAAARDALDRVSVFSRIAGGAAIALCFGALWVLRHRLRKPLAALTEAADAVANGQLGYRVAVSKDDEFGRLGLSFNRMIEQLAAERSQTDRAREALEGAVQERTAELAAANDNLRRADDVRRRFLADVSHELRTPLAAIRGEADVTLRARESTAEDYRVALARISEQAALSGGLVDDLLFIARNEGGSPRLKLKPVALAEIARRACADVQSVAEQRAVSVEIAETAPTRTVQGDPVRLRQLVTILLDNAVRYTEAGTAVQVVLSQGPGGVVLQVIDHGKGIADDEIEFVFDRFYRGEDASERHAEGSGLGLAMARAIVEAHGGEIGIESQPGQGTTVGVVLPVQRRIRAVS